MQREEQDPVVGLDVCGQVYYCHRSTLTQVSPYFASRFRGSFGAGRSYTDPQGRKVYFVERCPLSFLYIFRYMISLHAKLPLVEYDKDKALFRSIREEADYFGLAAVG